MRILEITKDHVIAWFDGVIFYVDLHSLSTGSDIVGTVWNGYKNPKKAEKGTLSPLHNGTCYVYALVSYLVECEMKRGEAKNV